MRYNTFSISRILRPPAICVLCGQYYPHEHAVCMACQALLTPLGTSCQYCALPLPEGTFLVCGSCSQQRPLVNQVLTAYRFEEPLRTLMHEYKYHAGLYLTTLLSTLMLHALPSMDYPTQCLIPVPLHPKRLRQRGFNQAALLALQLGRRINRPCLLSSCTKIANTKPQADLNAKQRKTNLRQAFLAKKIPYTHVTLVDDLLTTGSTANELARILKEQGVLQVDLWCCARATF